MKDFKKRLDGRVEWICEHGIGHPVIGFKTHGCDGCCSNKTDELKEEYLSQPKKCL